MQRNPTPPLPLSYPDIVRAMEFVADPPWKARLIPAAIEDLMQSAARGEHSAFALCLAVHIATLADRNYLPRESGMN